MQNQAKKVMQEAILKKVKERRRKQGKEARRENKVKRTIMERRRRQENEERRQENKERRKGRVIKIVTVETSGTLVEESQMTVFHLLSSTQLLWVNLLLTSTGKITGDIFQVRFKRID